jgi:CRP-like cAMP-binding protein
MAHPQPRTNQFLASLSPADYARLAPSLKPIALEQGKLLHEPGEEIKQIYFPQTGMISLLRVVKNWKRISGVCS